MKTLALSVVLGALALAACQTAAPPTARPGNRMLLNAGFTAKKPTTSEQAATLAALPPNQMVKQTVGNKVNYVVADPAGCGCLYVGGRAAFQNYRAMQNTMQAMTEPGPVDQLGLGSIDDLGVWSPL